MDNRSHSIFLRMLQAGIFLLVAGGTYFFFFLFLANRYASECGSLSDSSSKSHCRMVNIAGNETVPLVWQTCDPTKTPVGAQPGSILTRSSPFYWASSIFHSTSVLCVLLLWARRPLTQSEEKPDSARSVFHSKLRVLFLIFVFGIVSVMYKTFVVIKVFEKCPPSRENKIPVAFSLISGMVDKLMQSMNS